METEEELLEKLRPWKSRLRRLAWKPVVEAGDAGPIDSKFSGKPWISKNNQWPVCKLCELQMQFFLQINLDKLPSELNGKFGSGLLQFFYCTRDDCQGMGGWSPFENEMSMVRVLKPEGEASYEHIDPQVLQFPAKKIVSWQQFNDFPHPEEHGDLGLQYTYDFKANKVKVICNELNFDSGWLFDPELAENISLSKNGDKLSGWPYWIQGAEYPSCPKCSKRMELLFQVDSEDNVPFMWGDCGCGHITQCPEHKDVVGFGWACS